VSYGIIEYARFADKSQRCLRNGDGGPKDPGQKVASTLSFHSRRQNLLRSECSGGNNIHKHQFYSCGHFRPIFLYDLLN
jgi:hypothetical protein